MDDNVECIDSCTITEGQMGAVRTALGADADAEIVIPRAGQGIRDAPKGWTSLYVYPFTIGLQFPFPTLVHEFLKNHNVAISQVMPYVWRVLLTTIAMCEVEGNSINLGDLLSVYKYRSLGDLTYTLRSVEGRKGFVHMGKDKSEGWRGAFVYAKTATLGYDMSFVPETWRDIRAFDYPPATAAGKETIEFFYSLPLKRRSFPSVLIAQSEAAGQPFAFANTEDQDDMSANTGNTEKKRPSTKSFVARSQRLRSGSGGVTVIPSPAVSTVAASPHVAPVREPVVTRSSPAKANTAASSAPSTGCHDHPVRFPDNFGFGEGSTLWPFLSHLKLPQGLPDLKDRSLKDTVLEGATTGFKVNVQALEMLEVYERRTLAAEQENKVLASKVKEVADEVEKLQKVGVEVDKLQKVADDLSGKCNDALDQEFAAKEEVTRLTAELKEKTLQLQGCQEQLGKKKEQLLICGEYVTYLTKIECMEEYAAGKSSEWDLLAEQKAFDEAFPEKPVFSMLEAEEDQETDDASSKVEPAEKIPAEKGVEEAPGAAA